MTNDTHLTVHLNSMRRVPWHRKLGLQRLQKAPVVSIRSLVLNGGYAHRVDVIFLRVYPPVFAHMDSAGGGTLLTRRQELKKRRLFEEEQINRLEEIRSQFQREMSLRCCLEASQSSGSTPSSDASHMTARDLCRLFESAQDPEALEYILTPEQQAQLLAHREERKAQLEERLKARVDEARLRQRVVRRFQHVKIVGVSSSDNKVIEMAWRNPPDSLCDVPDAEGRAVSLFNLKYGRSIHGKEQLYTAAHNHFEPLPPPTKAFSSRTVTSLGDIRTVGFRPAYDELDVVGIVVKVEFNQKTGVALVYLTDATENSYFCLHFPNGIDEHCSEEVVALGSVVGVCNIEWRAGSFRPRQLIPIGYLTPWSIVSKVPVHEHLKSELETTKACLKKRGGSNVERRQRNIEALLRR